MTTRLGLALMNALQTLGLSQIDMAEKSKLCQATINKIISKKFRVDERTLKQVTNALDPKTNATLLIYHLEDEIERAGHKTMDYDIKHNPKKYSKRVENAMAYISSRINNDHDLAALIIDVVAMLQKADQQPLYDFEAGTGLQNVAETK